MDDRKEYKAISFRLNMQDKAEKELYDKIISESKKYTSIAAYMKIVLTQAISSDIANRDANSLMEKLYNQQVMFCDEIKEIIKSVNLNALTVYSEDALIPPSVEKIPDDMVNVLDYIGL